LDLGNTESALKYWKRAVSLKPTHAQAWINMVILLEQEGRYAEAKTIGENAMQFLHSEHTLHFILGNVYGKLSDYEKSEESFRNAIELCKIAMRRVPAKYHVNLGESKEVCVLIYSCWSHVISSFNYHFLLMVGGCCYTASNYTNKNSWKYINTTFFRCVVSSME